MEFKPNMLRTQMLSCEIAQNTAKQTNRFIGMCCDALLPLKTSCVAEKRKLYLPECGALKSQQVVGGNSPGCVSETSKKEERTDLGQRASDKSVKWTQPKKANTSLLAPQSPNNATRAGITDMDAS